MNKQKYLTKIFKKLNEKYKNSKLKKGSILQIMNISFV